MANVTEKFISSYNQFLQDHRDSRSVNLPLLTSNWQVPVIVAVYLLLVLFVGPRFMANRKPYELKGTIRKYNLLQVLVNGVLFMQLISQLIQRTKFSYVCQSVDLSSTALGYGELYISYAYFILKILDLVDTLFFVLRKKQSQLSFLHIYHHATMVAISYFGVLFVPGGHNLVLGLWNTLGHTGIYLYYYLTTYNSRLAARCKKHLTRLQLVQFIYLMVHFGRPALTGMDCGFPKLWHWIGLLQTGLFLALFLDFYIKSYVRKPQKLE